MDGKRYEYNPEKAKQLLKEAGVARGDKDKTVGAARKVPEGC